MKPADFVHLHLHTEYSLLDGANRVDDLCRKVAGMGQTAVAITDHGNLFGAIDFYKAARKHGIQPIIGFEAYVAPGHRTEKKQVRGDVFEPYYHLTLLARDLEGFHNLCKLSSIGYREGFYYKPRIDREVIERHSKGLIALSGCLSGELQRKLLKDDYDGARECVAWHLERFGREGYYLEYQDHGIDLQRKANVSMKELAREFDLPLVITNDSHYCDKEDHRAHDALLCIQVGKQVDDERRFRFDSDQFFVKSTEEMAQEFGEMKESLVVTREIAEKTDLELEFGQLYLPDFPIPEGFEGSNEYLRHLSREGISRRYGGEIEEGAADRLEYELAVIQNMGFAGYFLITQDFVAAARDMGCAVGPGRGSAAGSLVAYALGITNIDPLRYDLLFERFLNPERVSMPDIDIDFADDRREDVIEYVRRKYGEDCVSQIITFSRMKAKAAVRDVGRVLGMPFIDVDRVAKLVPDELNIKLKDAIDRVPELAEMSDGDGIHRDLLDMSQRLEGMCRHAGIHAAGVVIAPKPLEEFVPLFRTTDGDVATQWDMKHLEDVGLLKMDFLGLRTLTVIDNACRLVQESKGIEIDLDEIPLDDEATFGLFGRGATVGIFQFESGGMRDYLAKLKPERLGDLIAMNALYRPGPMDNIDEFIARKRGEQAIELLHPAMEPILRDTYGIIVYQEQVMRIAQELAGYSLGQADLLRRAMGKKKADVMAEQRGVFIAGCEGREVGPKIAVAVFELLEKFASYGFNKSHSAAYALLAYQTGYLKAHHPAEFMAASLTSVMNNSDQLAIFLDECRRMAMGVVPPDVFASDFGFGVRDGRVVFGLGAVKNVGKAAIESIVSAREDHGPFPDVFDWAHRLNLRLVNKRVVESLAAAGALDSFPGTRASKCEGAERVIDVAARRQRDDKSGQQSLFGEASGEAATTIVLEDVPDWPRRELLKREKELLGHYVSGHPLEEFRAEIACFSSRSIAEPRVAGEGTGKLIVCCLITSRRNLVTRRGEPMCVLTIEDFSGACEAVIWPDKFQECKELLEEHDTVVVQAHASTREGDSGVIVDAIYPLEDAFVKFASRLVVRLGPGEEGDEVDVGRLREILVAHGGSCPVTLHIETGDHGIVAVPLVDVRVAPSSRVDGVLRKVPGVRQVAWPLKGEILDVESEDATRGNGWRRR